jgi:4-amino-4-deoxy-L-arabinose transferase-like glycosyltransferase
MSERPYSAGDERFKAYPSGEIDSMQSRSFYRVIPYAVCFIACAAIDLFYFPHATVFPDEQRIFGSAIRLAASGEFWVGSDRAWEMPGTAIFFAPFVWLFGPHNAIVPIRIAQAVLVTVQCGLIAQIAGRIFQSRNVGFVASCIAAIYPFMLFYQGLLLSETLFNSFLLAGLAALFWWRDRGMKFDRALALAIFCFVFATLTKATLTILPPLLIAATAFLEGASLRRTTTILIAACSLYAAFMCPWWIRNGELLNAFVPFTTSSALNLYLGNNAQNREAGVSWASDVEPDFFAQTNAIPDEIARQHVFENAALSYIKNNPAIFIHNAAKKLVRFWNVIPNAVELRSVFYSLITATSFVPVLVFALICAGRRWRQWRLLAPLFMLIGYFTFVHIVTIASLRYRFPIEPLLIVLAAEPIAALIAYFRSQSQARRSAAKS